MNVRGPFLLDGRKSYYVDVRRKRRSLKTSDFQEAERKVVEIKRRLKKPQKAKTQKLEPSSMGNTFEAFSRQYLDWAVKMQPVKTFKANRLALRKLKPTCRGLPLNEIGAFHLDQMVAANLDNGLRPTSVNCYIRHAKVVMGQAVKWGLIPVNPFSECRAQRITKQPPKALNGDNIRALMDSIDDCYDQLMVRAYLITGRSRAELVRLKWDDVDFVKRRYYVTRTKTHLSKWYPMSSSLTDVFKALGPDKSGLVLWRAYHPDTISHKVKAYMVDAGLERFSLHCLRHSFARLYLETGGSIYALQQLLGHSQVTTTQVYSSMGVGKLAEEIEKVSI